MVATFSQGADWCRYYRFSAEILDCLFHPRLGPRQVVAIHHRLDLNAGVKRKEPWLSNGRYFRAILHIEENHARSFSIEFGEVDRFGFEISEDRLNLLDEAAILDCGVPLVNGDRNLEHHSHLDPPLHPCGAFVGRNLTTLSSRRAPYST